MSIRNTLVAIGLVMGVLLTGFGRQPAAAVVFCSDEVATLVATNSVTNGTNGSEIVFILVGTDATVDGKGGSDRICNDSDLAIVYGGTGDDTIQGKGSLHGQSGNDTIDGQGAALVDGGSGNDPLSGDAIGKVDDGSGNDEIDGKTSAAVHGGSGNDDITANNSGPTHGGSGNDTMRATDQGGVFGDSGDDNITGRQGIDLIDCGSGRDSYSKDSSVALIRRCEIDRSPI